MQSSPTAKTADTRTTRKISLAQFGGQLGGTKNGLQIDLKLSGGWVIQTHQGSCCVTKPPISQTKANLWDILKALASPDCLSMQADIKNFYKKLQGNKNLKQTKYSKNAFWPIE